jgi:hypothetical protein
VYLLYGAAAMTGCAALVEAFWSPQRALPSVLKYGVGIGCGLRGCLTSHSPADAAPGRERDAA